jgi:hypothetical protein
MKLSQVCVQSLQKAEIFGELRSNLSNDRNFDLENKPEKLVVYFAVPTESNYSVVAQSVKTSPEC